MENNEQMQQELKDLEIKLKDYDFISKKLGNIDLSESEINNFLSTFKEKIDERTQLIKKIADLRWQLMTPQEQKDYLDKYSED